MKKEKEFKDYNIGQVHSALIGMLNELGIAGSTPTYNLYNAVADEWKKAKEDIYPSERLDDEDDNRKPNAHELFLVKQLTCEHKNLEENSYHRAIKAGATKYCPECESHLKVFVYPEYKLHKVFLDCNCGCGYNEKEDKELQDKLLKNLKHYETK